MFAGSHSLIARLWVQLPVQKTVSESQHQQKHVVGNDAKLSLS